MAKSYVATLIGIALSEGKIKSLDDKVSLYLPELKDSGYADPTIRDLLRMRSGVDWLEVYKFGSDTQLTYVHNNSLVAYKFRWCDYAAGESKRGGKPGGKFNYSTLDTSVLGCLLERVVGMTGKPVHDRKALETCRDGTLCVLDNGRSRLGRPGSFTEPVSMQRYVTTDVSGS